jgi:sulfotransferase
VGKKIIHYLCGLPRSGNTLLSSILNQNPNIASTANSVIIDIYKELYALKKTETFLNFPDHKSYDNVIKSVMKEYYKDWKQKIIIDRGVWGIPNNLKFLQHYVNPKPKIIVLVRDVLEILASFIEWANNNYDAFPNRIGAMNTEKRCEYLMNKDSLIVRELVCVKHLLDHQSHLCKVIDYDNLVNKTEDTINSIYSFLEIKPFKHTFKNIKQFELNGIMYDDKVVGFNLHKLKTKNVSKTKRDINKVLPKTVIEKYKNLNIWKTSKEF